MTARGLFTLLFGALMLVTALSVGSKGAFLLGAAAIIALLLALLGVLCALFTCRVGQQLGAARAARGESCAYTLRIRLYTPVPVAPLALSVSLPSGRTAEFVLPVRMLGVTESENAFPCPHVGVYPVGAVRLKIGDCLGLFAFAKAVRAPLQAVTVLPVPAACDPVRHSPGEGEATAAQRAQADRSTPEDTRAWQEGDEMKRVHWKLSMRRQALMVHTYETPQRPDALVLLDCAAPEANPAQRPYVIDALTQQCAGVMKSLLGEGRIARMPLTGEPPREISGQDDSALPAALEALAQERFTHQDDFTRALYLASRRMRRTGSTVILSSRLTPAIADAALALSRMGPLTRFVLVTAEETTPRQEKLLALLRNGGVETRSIACAAPRRAADRPRGGRPRAGRKGGRA